MEKVISQDCAISNGERRVSPVQADIRLSGVSLGAFRKMIEGRVYDLGIEGWDNGDLTLVFATGFQVSAEFMLEAYKGHPYTVDCMEYSDNTVGKTLFWRFAW